MGSVDTWMYRVGQLPAFGDGVSCIHFMFWKPRHRACRQLRAPHDRDTVSLGFKWNRCLACGIRGCDIKVHLDDHNCGGKRWRMDGPLIITP